MGDFDFNDGIESDAPTQVVSEALRLQCLNKMLETIGEYTLDQITTDNPDQVQANSILDRVSRQIQSQRWHCNHRRRVLLEVPTDTIEVSGGLGDFEFGETVVETATGASGEFKYILDGVMFIIKDDGSADFLGADSITGQTSAANRDTAAQADITESRHALNERWLRVDSDYLSRNIDVCRTGDFLFDKDRNSFQFDFELTIELVLLIPLEDLPPALLDYICSQAAREFQQAARNGQVADGFSSEDVFAKRVVALNEDAENEDQLIGDRWVQQILGDRERRQVESRTR